MQTKFIDFLLDKKSSTDLTNAIIKPFESVLSNLGEAYIFGSAKMGARVHQYLLTKKTKVLGFIDNTGEDILINPKYFPVLPSLTPKAICLPICDSKGKLIVI